MRTPFRWYRTPRARWHDGLTVDERAELESLGLEAAQKKQERWNTPEHLHIAVAKWATEQRQSERRVSRWIMSIAVATLLVAAAGGAFTWWQWSESERPKLVTTGARLYINHSGSPPPELVQIDWRNIGHRAALRGTASVFTVSEDGKHQHHFGFSEITVDPQNSSTTLVPFGDGYAERPIDMDRFLGLFLVCVKYHDETNHSYKQPFLLRPGALLPDHVLTRLDELPSKPAVCNNLK